MYACWLAPGAMYITMHVFRYDVYDVHVYVLSPSLDVSIDQTIGLFCCDSRASTYVFPHRYYGATLASTTSSSNNT